MENIIQFISNFGLSLVETFGEVYDYLQYTVDVPLIGEVTAYELMFGFGFGTFITLTIVKWVVGIIM